MKFISTRALVLSIAVLSVSFWADADPVIGTAGKIELGADDVRRLIAGLPDATRNALKSNSAPLTQAVRAELVRRSILADAQAAHYDQDAAVAADLAKLRDEVVLRQWVARQATLPKGFPTDAEVDAAYQAFSVRVAKTRDYHLAQIFVALPDGADAAATAAALRKWQLVESKMAGGSTFADVAKEFSDHKDSAAKGGDLGYENEARLLPEVRSAVQGLTAKDKPVPVKSKQGLHLIKFIESKSAVPPPSAEIRTALIAELRRNRAEELERRYVAEMTAKASPAVNEVELNRLLADPKAGVAP